MLNIDLKNARAIDPSTRDTVDGILSAILLSAIIWAGLYVVLAWEVL